MATIIILLLAAACSVQAFPQDPLPYRNTIFTDEKLEGGVFEHVDEFTDVTYYSRSENNPYRLPTTTKPEHYNILMTTELPRMYFYGQVDINLYATEAGVNEIVIHAHDLNITSLVLYLGDTEIQVQSYTFEPIYHFLRIRVLNGVLQYNAINRILYTLSIAFEAPMRTDMTGMYRNWFRNNATDEVSMMASTHFQATAARLAFPCYDEPNQKAIFNMTIRRPAGYKSYFLTRLYDSIPSPVDGYEDDIYFETPVMSTYLLAWIVAAYETQSLYSDDGDLMYEVIARPNAINTHQGNYSFYVGQDLLEKMNDHTAYDFYSQHEHLKMTQAAIPDFRAGAMEDWGLLLYREAYIMYDPEHTTSQSKQLIAYILSHEIAHMWFGNLVTCDWWDVFWLNEGFARYYQYFLTHWVEDYMEFDTRFIPEQVHSALLSDSANNPHPLSTSGIGDPVQIRTMFSTISYNKGACIIRMTEHLLGCEVHREGLRQYLRNREFDTALPIHLFQALQNAAVQANAIAEYGPGFSVIDYYTSWTVQGGHPVLNVEIDHQTGLMTIYQRRFNINTGYSTAATNWIVPITFATASNPDFSNTKPSHIITEAITIINRTTVGDEWVIFNKQQTGFYRVNYDDYTWDLNVIALRGPQRTLIDEGNRAQILNDVFQFARSGIMTYNRAFNIISFLANETDYAPWVTAITGLNWIRNRLQGTGTFLARFDEILVEWTNTVISDLGYTPVEDESFIRSYLRYQLAPFVCNLNVNDCILSAIVQFHNLRDNEVEVFVDNRNWVYCNGLRYGTVGDFDFLWNRFLNHNVYNEKTLLLQTLGCTPHASRLNMFLDAIVDENFIIRPQDYSTAFSSAVNSNEGNTQIVFEYIQNNLEKVVAAFSLSENFFNQHRLPDVVLSYIYARLRTEQQVVQFLEWADLARDQLGTSYTAIRNGALSARNSIAWADAVEDDIMSYYNQRDQVLMTSTAAPVVVTEPSTVTPQPLAQPTTPYLPTAPGSANTAFLSTLVLVFAFIANFST